MAAGYALVRFKLARAQDSVVLSKLMVYVVCPCSYVAAFQVALAQDVIYGFLLAVLAALIIQVGMIVVVDLIAKPLHLSGLEKAAIIYPNCGNLIIPLVAYCLGDEWVVYSLAFISVTTIFMWTHGKAVIEGVTHFEPRKIFLNFNLIAIVGSLVLFALNIRFTGPIEEFVTNMGAFIGPLAMLITGMLVGGMTFKEVVGNKRVWLETALRLIFIPALVCLFLKFSGLASLLPTGQNILFITLLAAVAPSASNTVQITQVYGGDSSYASAINVVSTLMCIVTMPLWAYLYLL